MFFVKKCKIQQQADVVYFPVKSYERKMDNIVYIQNKEFKPVKHSRYVNAPPALTSRVLYSVQTHTHTHTHTHTVGMCFPWFSQYTPITSLNSTNCLETLHSLQGGNWILKHNLDKSHAPNVRALTKSYNSKLSGAGDPNFGKAFVTKVSWSKVTENSRPD